jgi:hypothetical protein
MPRTLWYKLKEIENFSVYLDRELRHAYALQPSQPPRSIHIELGAETAEYVLQALRIGLGEMSK